MKSYQDTPKCTPQDIQRVASFMREHHNDDAAFEFYDRLLTESFCYGDSHYIKTLTKGEIFMHAVYSIAEDIVEDQVDDDQLIAMKDFLINLCDDEAVQTDTAIYSSDKLGDILFDICETTFFESGELTERDMRDLFMLYQRLDLIDPAREFDEAFYQMN